MARQDAALTHPQPVCQQANSLFAMVIAYAVQTGCGVRDPYQQIEVWGKDMNVEGSLLDAIRGAATAPPANYVEHRQ